MIDQRLAPIATSMDLFFRAHFRFRYGYPLNPYQESIRRQKRYLEGIIQIPDTEPQQFLKRDGIVEKILSQHNHRNHRKEGQ